eukprot:gene24002-30289_t
MESDEFQIPLLNLVSIAPIVFRAISTTSPSIRLWMSNGLGNRLSATSGRNITKLMRAVGNGAFTVEDQDLMFYLQVMMVVGLTDTFRSISMGFRISRELDRLSYVCLCVALPTLSPLAFRFVPQIYGTSTEMQHVVVGIVFINYKFPSGKWNYELDAKYTINGGYNSSTNLAGYSSLTTNLQPSVAWSQSDYLTVLPTAVTAGTSTFNGEVDYLAIYNRELSFVEAKQNFDAGPPNSRPVVSNNTATILENGQMGDQSKNPAYYLSVIPSSSLSILYLSVVDRDNNLGSPNIGGPRPFVYLTTYPALSTLYYLNGTEIARPVGGSPFRILVPYDEVSGGYALRIRPPWNVYSTSSSPIVSLFSYVAVDGQTGLISTEEAWMHVMVTHVNKPPVITSNQVQTVSARTMTIITLSGTDSDSAIVSAQVTVSNSGIAQMFLVYPNGSISNINLALIGTSVVSLLSAPFRFAYNFLGSQYLSSSQSNPFIAQDAITFTLKDDQGVESAKGQIAVNVVTALLTSGTPLTVKSPTNAVSNVKSNITIYGTDLGSPARTLRVRIIVPPVYGSILNVAGAASSDTPAIAYDYVKGEISAGSKRGVQVTYLSNLNWFSTPKTMANGTKLNNPIDCFTYILVTTAGTAFAQSTLHTQCVDVMAVSQLVLANYSYSDNITRANGFTVNAWSTGSVGQGVQDITFDGFQFTDPNLSTDYVVVHYKSSSGKGLLDINSKFIKKTMTNALGLCNGPTSWTCMGDGYVDKEIIFVATVSDALGALNGAVYKCYQQNVNDVLTFSISHGVGDSCLAASQQSTNIVRSGCLVSTVTINMKVIENAPIVMPDSSDATDALVEQLTYVGIAVLCCLILMGCRCLQTRVLRNHRKRDEDGDLEAQRDFRREEKKIEKARRAAEVAEEAEYKRLYYILVRKAHMLILWIMETHPERDIPAHIMSGLLHETHRPPARPSFPKRPPRQITEPPQQQQETYAPQIIYVQMVDDAETALSQSPLAAPQYHEQQQQVQQVYVEEQRSGRVMRSNRHQGGG